MPPLFARCTIERRRTSRPPPLPSPPAAHRSPGAIFFPLLPAKLCFSSAGMGGKGHFLPTDRHRQRELTHLPSFHSLFISPLLYFASFTILTSPFGTLPLHSLQALQGGGGGWWRSEGDYDRHGMKVVGEKRRKGGREKKVALIGTCQERLRSQSYFRGKGGKKSNLALGDSLSNISAISCHRSE